MKKGTKCVLVLDLGQNTRWYYGLTAKCARDPEYLHPGSHVMTDDMAIQADNELLLEDCENGEYVFVKTTDKFYTIDDDQNFVPGLNVWRLVQIVEQTVSS